MQNPTLTSNSHDTAGFQWGVRLRAAGLHLLISAAIALLAAGLVFVLWYPWPYRELSGGRDLFILVISVDIVLGPLITFSVFNLRKPRKELVRDLAMVGMLQLAALCYGLWTVQAARPVHLAFEYDRLRVVHAIDIPPEELPMAPPELAPRLWAAPTPVALRAMTPKEQVDYTVAALNGLQLSARPALWSRWDDHRAAILAAAEPLPALIQRIPKQASALQAGAQAIGRDPAGVVWLPVLSRGAHAWTALLDPKTADILAYVAVDPY